MLVLVLRVAVVLALVVQLALSPSLSSAVVPVIAAALSLFVIWYLFDTAGVFSEHPLSAMPILGLTVATHFGPLMVKTFSIEAMAEGLNAPHQVMLLTASSILAACFGHSLYRRIPMCQSLSLSVHGMLSGLRVLSAPTDAGALLMGLLGLCSLYVNGAGGGSLGAFGKFFDAFAFLIYAPFVNAIRLQPTPSGMWNIRIQADWKILVFAVLLLLIALARNARGIFVSAPFAAAILFAAYWAQNRISYPANKQKLVFMIMFATAFGYGFSNISDAMVSVRSERETSSLSEMISATWEALGNENITKEYRGITKALRQYTEYDESYFSSELAARLVTLKFDDNLLFFGGQAKEQIAGELRSDIYGRIVALLPTPVIKFFGLGVDKEAVAYSFGDLVYHLSIGLPLGGYKTGSSSISLYLTVGVVGMLCVVAMATVLASILLDAYCSKRSGIVVISPFAALQIYSIYMMWNQDSILNVISFLSRRQFEAFIVLFLIFAIAPHLVRRQEVRLGG